VTPPINPFTSLSPVQLEIARLLAEGLTNGQIAKRRGSSVKTIDSHRLMVMKRLKTKNNVELARLAICWGEASDPKTEGDA
jgi:DNA-binding CsgD family transcriptional regulator